MLEICLLGTGGTMPLPERALTALLIRYNGKSLLIDCGEGTQVAVREKGWSLHPIDAIFFTHFHADHITGLPGFLLTMGKFGRTEPVQLIGPPGLTHVVESLCIVAPDLPFPVTCLEITEPERTFEKNGLRIEAFEVDHGIPCWNYSILLERPRRFQPEKALALGIEKRNWGRLQRGEIIFQEDGRCFRPEMVLGEIRKGIKVTYCTDTRPTPRMEKHAIYSDLLICEGMYGDADKQEKALQNKHMTFQEAAQFAKQAQVRELWLTHYSPSLSHPEEFLEQAQSIFPNTVVPQDRRSVDLKFED